ncbi:hypothetical protein ACFU7X_04295 [Streptomyces chartreusis]|uniref:hypothetical protein n=1 Tax=Streptomyces chartreusis TaxID=1969 RepID=UPI00369A6A32
MELASGAYDAASAIVVGCLLSAVAVIACGFIARERLANPRRSPSRTGPDSAERGLSRTVLFGGVAVVIGHLVGSATRNRWAFHWGLAFEVLVYALALHFYEFVVKRRELTPTTRRISVAGLVLMAFVGSASAAYSNEIL